MVTRPPIAKELHRILCDTVHPMRSLANREPAGEFPYKIYQPHKIVSSELLHHAS
jgi:hypothetical protein